MGFAAPSAGSGGGETPAPLPPKDRPRRADQGKVRVVVSATFPLEAAAQAEQKLEREHLRGKVVLQVGRA